MTEDEFHDWRDQDLVVLRGVYQGERNDEFVDAPYFPDLDPVQVHIAFQRLRDDGLIAGHFAPDSNHMSGARALSHLRVTPEGLRRLRMWPTDEDYTARLIRDLEVVVASEPDDRKRNVAAQTVAAPSHWVSGARESRLLVSAHQAVSAQVLGQTRGRHAARRQR